MYLAISSMDLWIRDLILKFFWITCISILVGYPPIHSDEAVTTLTLGCCDIIPENDSCVDACQQLSLSSSTEIQLRQLTEVAKACPNTLTGFWQCINQTFAVVSGAAERWSGKTCCDLTLQPQCQHSCKRAKSRDDLTHCRPNEEVTFFHCLERQEVSAGCCGPATSSQCRATCKSLFWASTPSASDLESVQDFCPPSIVSCVRNYTQTMFISPEEAVPCCQYSQSESCRTICQQAMLSDLRDEDKYDLVTSECEEAALGTDMWNCLLLLSAKSKKVQYDHGGRIDLIGMDNAKLQCCTRALTNKCQELCANTFSNGWDRYYGEFLEECVNNIKEVAMAECVREVDQPCQMGCNSMSYCTNFNHRPMELFQSCNAEADEGAARAVQLWSSGTIILPYYTDQFIPIKDIRTCRPEVWQAIACILYIKPCERRSPASQICRQDCISILTECMDMARLQPGVSAASFCNLLSPEDDTKPCMSMNYYTVESPYTDTFSEITTPCTPNPCPDEEICVLRHRKCKHPGDPDCKQYQCKRACHMGEISSFLVPHKTFVKISKVSHEDVHVNCYRGCKCGHNNQILNCKTMGCIEPTHCLLRSGRIQDHNTQFLLDCNQCSCYGGERVCTNRICLTNRATDKDIHQYTGLPCNCASHYEPVCASNGQTFPNSCLAECSGYADSYIDGSCQQLDPCHGQPCDNDQLCVPRRDVCLSSKSSQCKQYECVPRSGECNRHYHEAVCDVSDEEYTNVCMLIQKSGVFAHWGHCMLTCRRRGLVCGMNSVTYDSECAAWADSVYMDYFGACHAVGQLLNLKSGEPSCPEVQCPALPTGTNCRPITPPGTCCPKCVGEIRVLISPSQSREATRVIQGNQMTIRDVIEVFRRHISVLECDAFSYYSIEGDLVIIIAPITRYPTALQIQACMSETEKIGSLIASRSPIIMMYLATSHFISASTRTSHVIIPNSAPTLLPSTLSFSLLVTVCILLSAHR